jgi:hypothetical protein
MNQGRADIVPLDRQGDLRQAPETDLSRDIRQRLFDPLRDAIAGTRRIVIAPDGVLCQVPFAALVKEGEGEARLIDDLDIQYVTSARALLEFGRPTASPKAPLVIADPDFDLVKGFTPEKPDSAETAPYYFYFPPLPGTADEGWAVAGLLGTTQTIALVRVAEVELVPIVAVTPERIIVRGEVFEWGDEAMVRRLGKGPVPVGIERVEITDARRRYALRSG